MGFKTFLENFFHGHDDRVTEEVTRDTGFWSNPIFQDKRVKDLYVQYLLHSGKCPVCNDFCFINIEKEGVGFKVVKECVSTDCSYSVDISGEFNKDLGISLPVEEDDNCNVNSYHYLDFPMDTGELEYTVLSKYDVSRREYVGELYFGRDAFGRKYYKGNPKGIRRISK